MDFGPTSANAYAANIGFAGTSSGIGSTLTVQGQTGAAGSNGGQITVVGGTAGTTGTGGTVAINGGAASATSGSSGGGVNITGADGTATSTGGSGGAILIQGGNGTSSGNNNGGNVTLEAGSGTGSGTVGSTIVKNAANSTSAFQIQNAAGEQELNVSDTNPVTDLTNNQNNNEITNSSFEGANLTTGWTATASTTLAQTTTVAYVGNDSMQVNTNAAANAGAYYNLTSGTTLVS